jgi:hypothetical protein
MKRTRLLPVLAVICAACATTTTKAGSEVKVFGADPAVKQTPHALPEGCRLLESTAPFDQEENERVVYDPYAKQRNEVAAKGGNLLLVFSQTIIRQPSQDCAPGSQTPGCLEASQTWYRVSFGYYACSPEALGLIESQAESAAARKGPLFTWKLGSSRVAAAQMKSTILEMMKAGVGTDVIVAYVKGEKLKTKLTSNEIIDWKKAGIDDKVIQAALGD